MFEEQGIESVQDLGMSHLGGGDPYNSFGNGAAMRVSAVGHFARDEADCLDLARESAVVTHIQRVHRGDGMVGVGGAEWRYRIPHTARNPRAVQIRYDERLVHRLRV